MIINNKKNKYDLEERTTKFAESVIDFIKTLKISPLNIRIIEQLVGSAGSIGANYCEATEAESKQDFIHKMGICKKEIKETSYWIRLLARVHNDKKNEIKLLWKEAHELLLIFSKIIQSSKSSKIDN